MPQSSSRPPHHSNDSTNQYTTNDDYSLAAYQYELPTSLIAQEPITPRDRSRLMV
ncbi:MAG: S-adenosylmethionine:tRNA ribosyltransferase-isomerase, partial [Cyanobacteria bacterium J06628_4]